MFKQGAGWIAICFFSLLFRMFRIEHVTRAYSGCRAGGLGSEDTLLSVGCGKRLSHSSLLEVDGIKHKLRARSSSYTALLPSPALLQPAVYAACCIYMTQQNRILCPRA